MLDCTVSNLKSSVYKMFPALTQEMVYIYNVVCVCLPSSSSQVERFGKPTWRRLVEAVEDHVGGNNSALAQTIAAEHPGVCVCV